MTTCGCSTATKLIFPCSGAADVGEITDLAARKLTKEKAGKMFCLAGIGGKVSGIVESTKSASKILVIDGCSLGCAKKTMNKAGFDDFEYLELSSIDLKKGHSPATNKNIDKVVIKGKSLLTC